MEIAKETISLTFRGFWDCLSGIYKLVVNYILPLSNELSLVNVERISVRDSPSQGNVRSILGACFSFGFYFLASDYIFYNFLLPSAFTQLVEWTGEDKNSYAVVILENILSGIFIILWILPLICLNKFMNFNWYQDIANLVLLKSGQKKYEDIKMSDFYADQIKSLVLQMLFCVQGFIIYALSLFSDSVFTWYVETVWYFFHCALLSSLYAFEYKWVYAGMPLHRRIYNIAAKWPYYLGFGIPLAAINFYSPSVTSSVILFATLFPIYVISSSVTHDRQCPAFRYPFHIFKFADFLSDWIIKISMKALNVTLGST